MAFKKPHKTIVGAHEPYMLKSMFSNKRDCFCYTSHDKNDLEIKVIYVHHYIADE